MSEPSASTGARGPRLPGRAGQRNPRPRRWLILATVGLAQLMVVVDAAIVNIALPSAQRALGFTTVDWQWGVTAYALAFGSLLLSGGRLAAAGKVALRPNYNPGSDRFSAAQPDQEQRR